MFRAARDEGLAEEHPVFFQWFVEFIQHFIRVYEQSAPTHTVESAMWSADPENIRVYEENGRRMDDVIGVGVREW
jgi:hypothetical protein